MSSRDDLQSTLDRIAAARGFDRVDLASEPPPPKTEESRQRDSSVAKPSRAVRLARARDAKAARSRARAARAAERDRQWHAQHARELAKAGYAGEGVLAPATWRAGWACMSDHAGHAAQNEYDRFPAAIRGCVRRAIAGRTFRNSRARMIVGAMAVLWRHARLTRTPARRRLVVEYLSIDTLSAALNDHTSGRRPARSTLRHNWHRPGGNLINGQVGAIDALRQVGAMHWLQRKQCADDPTCNQYWILDPRSPFMNAAQREFLNALTLDGSASIARAPPGLSQL